MFSSTLPMCKCLWSCKKSKLNTAAHKSGYYTFTLKNYSYKCKQSRTDSAVTEPLPPIKEKNTSQNIQVLTEQKLNANDIWLFCPYKSLRCLPQQTGLSNLLYFPKNTSMPEGEIFMEMPENCPLHIALAARATLWVGLVCFGLLASWFVNSPSTVLAAQLGGKNVRLFHLSCSVTYDKLR
jgi:hypothetical protein